MNKDQVVNLARLSGLFMAVMGIILAAIGSTALSYRFASDYQDRSVLGKKDKRPEKSQGKVSSDNKGKKGPEVSEEKVTGNPAKGNSVNKGNPQTATYDADLTPVNSNRPLRKPRPALVYKDKVDNTKKGLKEVADKVKTVEYNEEVAEEIEDAADEVGSTVDVIETAEAIEKADIRPAWKSVLMGPDYKNLGQLRSSLVRNRNTLRKLNRVKSQVQNEETAQQLENHISELEQEQQQIQSVITENEDKFSVLGWAFRLLSGYNLVEDDEDLGGDEDTDTENDGSLTEGTEPSTELPTEEDDTEDTQTGDEDTDTSTTGTTEPSTVF